MKPNDIANKLVPFARHARGCPATGVLWDKGPCDCDFSELVVQLRGRGYSVIDDAINAHAPQPPRLIPGLLESVADGRHSLGVCGEAGKPRSVEFLRVELSEDDRVVVCRRLSDGAEFRYTVSKR